jgi:hypothetical protein
MMQLLISKFELFIAVERIDKHFKFEMRNGGGDYIIEPDDIVEAILLALTSENEKEADRKLAYLYNKLCNDNNTKPEEIK